jgi:FdhD protein
MALRICKEHGIGLIGYVRGNGFRIAACPDRLHLPARPRIAGVAAVILAGGGSSRMGRNKALLQVEGGVMIEAVYRRLSELFDEVILVTNTPELYDFIPCRKIGDIFPEMGPLGGIHAALSACSAGRIFVTGCDMPSLNPLLIRELCTMPGDEDAVIPETPGGLEPLHAVYSKSGLPAMTAMLQRSERSVLSFFDRASIKRVSRDRISRLDPEFRSFRNVNTPEEYRHMVDSE